MSSFYSIIVIIAIIILIIALTIVGLTLDRKKNMKPFPDYKNTCPDFWTLDANNKCIPSLANGYKNTPIFKNLVLWLDAGDSSTISMNGTKISEWRDKSVNNYKFIQGIDANQPTYTTTQLSGMNGIQFSSSTFMYQYVDSLKKLKAATSMSVYIVLKTPSTRPTCSNWGNILLHWRKKDGTDGNSKFAFSLNDCNLSGNSQKALSLWAGGNRRNHTLSPNYDTSKDSIFGFTISSGSSTISLNGNSQTFTGTNTLITSSNSDDIFSINDSLSAHATDFAIYEILAFDSQLSTKDCQAVEGYLANKWGLNTLPNSHPYKQLPDPINFHPNDSKWASVCTKTKWAKSHGILWDGVANNNSCS